MCDYLVNHYRSLPLSKAVNYIFITEFDLLCVIISGQYNTTLYAYMKIVLYLVITQVMQ